MKPLSVYISEYRKQIEKGDIKVAYKKLMEYMMELRNHLKNKYPYYSVSGNLYFGYMDMTYFSVVPKSLKDKKLKIAVVFIHDKISFEVWLSGINKQIQLIFWKKLKETGFDKYRIPLTIKGKDSIVEFDLVNQPDFDNLTKLTEQIEKGTIKFIQDIETYLSKLN
jgi:hypothetical protein